MSYRSDFEDSREGSHGCCGKARITSCTTAIAIVVAIIGTILVLYTVAAPVEDILWAILLISAGVTQCIAAICAFVGLCAKKSSLLVPLLVYLIAQLFIVIAAAFVVVFYFMLPAEKFDEYFPISLHQGDRDTLLSFPMQMLITCGVAVGFVLSTTTTTWAFCVVLKCYRFFSKLRRSRIRRRY